MTKTIYYNFQRILSYNAGYNFIVGGRGIGKTFGAQELVIKDAVRKTVEDAVQEALISGAEFVYVRRYKDDIKVAKQTFFDAVAFKFPKLEFRVQGDFAQYAKALPSDFHQREKKEQARIVKERQWTTIGYFIALSLAQKYKSTAYPRVRTIIFDEFIIEKGFTRYLPDEMNVFNGLYSTIARNRKGVRVLFLANSVSLDNPYFIALGINPDHATNEIIIMAKGWVAVHFPDAAAFDTDEFQTRFRTFITEEMEEYADYAVSNQFSDNHKLLIEGKDYKADYLYSIETEKGTYSIWSKFLSGTIYVQAKLPKQQNLFTIIPSRMSEEKLFLENNNPVLQQLRTAWRTGNMRFDTAATRNGMLHIFKK